MLKCKTCGMIFNGGYVDEDKNKRKDSLLQHRLYSGPTQVCSRGHPNEYAAEDYVDLS
jgi:hypothetical protein